MYDKVYLMSKDDSTKKSEFLSVRVAKEIKEELEGIAQENERSVSWVVGKIIEKYLNGKSRKL